MRCYICNKVLDAPRYNRLHKDYDPCNTCLEVIHGVFNDFPDEFETGEAIFNPLLDTVEDIFYEEDYYDIE